MKTIFLVEDDQHLADGLILNLEAEGYQVVHVADGNLAMDAYEKGIFDLVLLDIMLPGVDGLTICKKIRAAPPATSSTNHGWPSTSRATVRAARSPRLEKKAPSRRASRPARCM